MIRFGLTVLFFSLLSACSYSEVVVSGPVQEAIEADAVTVYYERVPQCEFSVVAHIKLPGGYYSRESLIMVFRSKAAEVGATGVQITHIQKIGSREYHGSARAIRCEPS